MIDNFIPFDFEKLASNATPNELISFYSTFFLQEGFEFFDLKIPLGVKIWRLRRYENNINKLSQISYHPNPKLNRANLQNDPVFYGSLHIPSGLKSNNNELKIALPTATSEMWYWENHGKNGLIEKDYMEFIAGMWNLKKKIKAFPIIYSDIIKNNFLKEVKNKHIEKGLSKNSIEILTFLTSLFLNKKLQHGNNYNATAAFAYFLFNYTEIEAIVYPSVRTGYKGFNIAIKKNVVDEALEIENIIKGRTFYYDHVTTNDIEYDLDKIIEDQFFLKKSSLHIGADLTRRRLRGEVNDCKFIKY